MSDKKKYIYFEPKGRLGNALFRYFAILLILKSNSHLTYGGVNRHRYGVITIDDNSYKNIISNNNFQLENKNINLLLNGFYQLQEFANYRY